MGTPGAKKQKNSGQPKSLAALDYEILSRIEGRDVAIKVMLIANALRKESTSKETSN